MPLLPTFVTGQLVTAAQLNGIVTDINSLTDLITPVGDDLLLSHNLGVGVLFGTSYQLHVYGAGQTTANLTNAGNTGGTIFIQDSLGNAGNGGAIRFGASQGSWAAIKSMLVNGTYTGGNYTLGTLSISVRRVLSDTSLTEIMRVDGTGRVFIKPTTNSRMTCGLSINQHQNTDEILALKASTSGYDVPTGGDIYHPFTDVSDPDTFGAFRKNNGTQGGLRIIGMAGTAGTDTAVTGIKLDGYSETQDQTKSTAAMGAVMLSGGRSNGGTGIATLAADSNLLVVSDHTTARFVLDSDGDSHQDVGTAWTNFDREDDVQVLRLLSAHVTRADDPLRESFATWLEHSREPLTRLKLVAFNEDGRHFVNMSRLTMLLTGAVRQVATRLEQLEQRALTS